jgi:hypothetical protein
MCNSTGIIAGTEYAMLAGIEQSPGEFEFRNLDEWASHGESTSFATMLTARDGDGCDVLSKVDSSWTLSSMASKQSNTSVPIPPAWRVVAASSIPCNRGQPCGEAYLAGWDGAGIVVALLKQDRDKDSGAWSIHPRFRVQPGLGKCIASRAACEDARKRGSYDNVTALLFEDAGESLTVLYGNGLLDSWNVPRGTLLTHRRLGNHYTAMCHYGEHFLLARSGDGGPILELIDVSPEIQSTETAVQAQVAQGVVII